MAIRPFLAMTAAEMRNCTTLPPKTAWMACHFSPYGLGLSNLPRFLPPHSLLTVDDITPLGGHDPEAITRQLTFLAESFALSGILLDLQRPGYEEAGELVSYLSRSLPCPVAVSEAYAAGRDAPVFLSPVPPSVPVREYLLPWTDREIWLDVSAWGEILTLTEEGCRSMPLPPWELPGEGFTEPDLHCRYNIIIKESAAQFTLWRTEEDLASLLAEVETLGVTNAVGLYQELYTLP